MDLNALLRLMPAADSPQQNRNKEAQDNDDDKRDRFFTYNVLFEEDA